MEKSFSSFPNNLPDLSALAPEAIGIPLDSRVDSCPDKLQVSARHINKLLVIFTMICEKKFEQSRICIIGVCDEKITASESLQA